MSNEQKRKAQDDSSSDDENEDFAQEIVDVDFDFYGPEESDYHAIKRLLQQLFSSDAELIDLGDLADTLIANNSVGTTVKVDEQESDPYAFLSVINLDQNKEKAGIQSLLNYIRSKCPKTLDDEGRQILELNQGSVGWIVSERLINMPAEIMPPMYRMLQQEIKDAQAKNEPYNFDWYLFVSKTYKEVASTLDEEMEEGETEPMRKKQKKDKALSLPETMYFQPEDELLPDYATYQFDFKFTHSDKETSSDAKRVFSDTGIATMRKLFLVSRERFADLVDEIEKSFSTATATQS